MVRFNINRPGVARDSIGSTPAASASPARVPVAAAKPARSPRRRVLIGGIFQSLTSTNHVSIRNLSTTGASILSDAPLKIGAEGVLQSVHLDCLGKIVWSRGSIYGFKFDQPLANAVVLELHRITADDVARAQSAATRDWYEHQAR